MMALGLLQINFKICSSTSWREWQANKNRLKHYNLHNYTMSCKNYDIFNGGMILQPPAKKFENRHKDAETDPSFFFNVKTHYNNLL